MPFELHSSLFDMKIPHLKQCLGEMSVSPLDNYLDKKYDDWSDVMLRIICSENAKQAKSYYTMSLKQECSLGKYYAKEQELIGEWHGRGAERLGLSGGIDQKSFESLCDNQIPGSDGILTVRKPPATAKEKFPIPTGMLSNPTLNRMNCENSPNTPPSSAIASRDLKKHC